MTRPTKLVVDCSTNISEIVDLTDEEIAQLEKDAAENLARRKDEEAKAKAKAEAKASAIAKLAALGLTEEEATALVG